jgi:hypothetical protein
MLRVGSMLTAVICICAAVHGLELCSSAMSEQPQQPIQCLACTPHPYMVLNFETSLLATSIHKGTNPTSAVDVLRRCFVAIFVAGHFFTHALESHSLTSFACGANYRLNGQSRAQQTTKIIGPSAQPSQLTRAYSTTSISLPLSAYRNGEPTTVLSSCMQRADSSTRRHMPLPCGAQRCKAGIQITSHWAVYCCCCYTACHAAYLLLSRVHVNRMTCTKPCLLQSGPQNIVKLIADECLTELLQCLASILQCPTVSHLLLCCRHSLRLDLSQSASTAASAHIVFSRCGSCVQ